MDNLSVVIAGDFLIDSVYNKGMTPSDVSISHIATTPRRPADTARSVNQAPVGGVTVTMMSMNINGQAGWYADEPARQWRARAPIVRAVIEERRPDIVCWQEFGVTCRQDAIEGSSHPLDFYMGEQAGDIYINPISWDPEKFSAAEQRTFWLTEDGRYGKAWDGSERGCSTILLEHRATGKRLWVYNVHLDNKGRIARSEGIRLILSDIDRRAAGLPVIIAGDFNTSSWRVPGKEQYFDPEPLNQLLQANFKDAFRTLDPAREVPQPTFHAYQGRRFHHEHDPFGVWDPDHIFVRGLWIERVAVVGPGDNEDVPQPSDHYPLETTLIIL